MLLIIEEYIWVFLMSMLPIVELRGGIPLGLSMGLPLIPTFIVAVLGNILPVPFIVFFAQAVLRWCAKLPKVGHIFQKIIDKAQEKSQSEAFRKGELWALFTFVAIPLPGTGAWTGSLIAAILQINWRKALPVVFCGVVAAGVIMSVLSFAVGGVFAELFGFAAYVM